jgi:hypothetical protein
MRQEIDARPEENDELCPPVPLACVSKVSASRKFDGDGADCEEVLLGNPSTEQLDAIRRRSCGYE